MITRCFSQPFVPAANVGVYFLIFQDTDKYGDRIRVRKIHNALAKEDK